MRICVINPYAGTEFCGEENLRVIAAPGTTFTFENVGDRYPLTNNQWLYFKHACTGPTIDRAIEAEREGFDAVLISCNLDIGLYECRQMCTIPVTATLESAALTAHMMARRFSLLCVDDQNGQIQKMLLEQYQLDKGLVSVRSFGIDANDLYVDKTSPEETTKKVQDAARLCVEEDGAEVLISGCTLAGSILTRSTQEGQAPTGAPIIDGMLSGFKLAETMATLQAAGQPPVSRLGVYEQPPFADLQRLRDAQGQAMPAWAEEGRKKEKGKGKK